ncbi:STAS domain-containing protein [Streptomyces sp. 8P21H-1]|uniref:STAS domain-containing protein n=1 Tax=Streptomyces sp. 8P21H-1 TaxID=2737048 RepID=UPI00157049C5|nr:STAS domain-containing protein [Streptomyces sp. 8P21H-1]NSL43898.1 STAS domain-containing protein [Streptomyces sp. 8P21H-1]
MPLHNSRSLPETDLPGAHARCFPRGEVTVVELHGEIDLCSAGRLTVDLDIVTGRAAPHVLVDLRPVTFIDSSGLNLLHRAHCRARSRGGSLRLVTDQPRVRQLLHLTAPGLLPVSATLEDAERGGTAAGAAGSPPTRRVLREGETGSPSRGGARPGRRSAARR